MPRLHFAALLTASMVSTACASHPQAATTTPVERTITLTEPVLTYQIGDGNRQSWDLPTNFQGTGDGPFSIGYVPYEDGYAVFGIDLNEADTVPVCFDLPTERACFDVTAASRADLTFTVGETTYPVRLRAQTPAAFFSSAYQQANKNRITTIAPPFYELVNVAIALTDTAEANPGAVYTDTDYYRRLRTYFDAHKSHRLITRIDAALQEKLLNYYIIKTNGLTYQFDDMGRIVSSPVYFRGGFPGSQVNEMTPYVADLQAFADETDFLSFYEANKNVFEEQVAFFEKDIDVNDMWTWLNRNFPDADAYDTVKIVLSPLVGYVQYLLTYEENGFRELQPHINFPYRSQSNLSAEGAAIAKGTLLFTEMNHGFISPPSALVVQIEEAFADVAFWVDPESDSISTYGTPLSAFDEYMNWALLNLYAYDRMSEEDWRAYQENIIRVMANNRGFPHFKAFSDRLVALYLARPEGTIVADLYPALIAWAGTYYANQSGAASASTREE